MEQPGVSKPQRGFLRRPPVWVGVLGGFACTLLCSGVGPTGDAAAITRFKQDIQPLLVEYCYDCHGDGMKKGGVAFDKLTSDDTILNHELWLRVLKNVRAGLMPPPEEDHKLPPDVLTKITDWIKNDAFRADTRNPDPGRVTLRRLNRIEYRNTIRDLMGVDYNTDEEFPPDDTGYGFDTIADVLTVSPMLLEKYLAAAETVVAAALPSMEKVPPERAIPVNGFKSFDGATMRDRLSYYQHASFGQSFKVDVTDNYRLVFDVTARGAFDFDPGKCQVIFWVDDEPMHVQEFLWQNGKRYKVEIDVPLESGEHEVAFDLYPLVPIEKKTRNALDLSITGLTLQGPLETRHWQRPKNLNRFLPPGDPPLDNPQELRKYTRGVFSRFASKAFRRPVDDRTVERLVDIAEAIYKLPGKKYEDGLRQAMVSLLSSPRFLYRIEAAPSAQHTSDPAAGYSLIDEYALASRLSYLFWSSMPDDELLTLAGKGELRANLKAQVQRLLADRRSEQFIENFTGQWLQARDVEGIVIDARSVVDRVTLEKYGLGSDTENRALRRAMRQETEMYFGHIVKEDRSILELIDSNYTFLNEKLAAHYGIPDVQGTQMRKVTLPDDSPRGGIITQGTMLLVTSNPTRTSPVKRGLFILDNIVGMPPPPPPDDIPPLEEAKKVFGDKEPTLRQMLELHRAEPLCSSCHNRMDPLGLALENFNALEMWRDNENQQPISAGGKLITGEQFTDIRQLKKILATEHRQDVYRCLTEKMMTYALGRGLEYYDVQTVDRIVAELDKSGGRFSTMLIGIIESAPFQMQRNFSSPLKAMP